ncbi:HesA/MoeB/ThiF family protein [Clostridium formicaceticum]|uniref:Molybdopterin biosynthesis protein MoeB n=1 Tax=Clostridium formicaceticum TaxID=1497 RepID=A0ABM6EYP5_9CLOT|nr:HesA/MoeB/ThiF family protein [Clostridium formicaceticum]AOY78227.1 molybdopterin biosynthesis protein MoeB [Clostridium formicaceticum]
MKRYERNMKTLSEEENQQLRNHKVCVIGCGGLGGYIIEMLGRLGIGYITAVDGDVFDASNLNRQILSNEATLGKSKAETAKARMALVNSDVYVNAIVGKLNKENAEEILQGHDIIIDALDNIETRFILQETAEKFNIPLVHGAIAGWYGQVTTILPGDRTLDVIYAKKDIRGVEKELGNPSFTPALVASIEVSEVLKLLIGRGEILRRKILFINTLELEYNIVEL